jgi:hypothetical protein
VFAALQIRSENAPLLLSGELGRGPCSLTPGVAGRTTCACLARYLQVRVFLVGLSSGELGCSRSNLCSPSSVP